MRPRTYVIVAVVLVQLFLVSRLVAFIQLFFEHSGIAITQNEIAQAHPTGSEDRRPQLIPKIIHQVFHDWKYHNQTMPSDWDEVRQTCIDSNVGWEYRVCASCRH